MEGLERRELLAGEPWGPGPRLIDHWAAVRQHPGLTGAGQAIAVIDTGVDYGHPVLGKGFGAGHKVVAGYDFVENDGNPSPGELGHGTGVAGVLAAEPYVYRGLRYQGIATGAEIVALRAETPAQVKRALRWVANHRELYNITAVNLTDFSPARGPTVYAAELRQLARKDVFIGTPAGNNGPDVPPQWPARDPSVVAVGAVNFRDQLTGFSQRGAAVEMLAPGENVTIPFWVAGRHTYSSYADGTSWATPNVVGAAVLLRQVNAELTNAQIVAILRASGVEKHDNLGNTYERLDLDGAIKLAYRRSAAAGVAARGVELFAAGSDGGRDDKRSVFNSQKRIVAGD